MKTDTNLAAKSGETRETRVEKTIRLLMSMDGDPKHQKLKDFEKFYPAALHAISQKMPRKTILKHLSEGGLKLYPALFDEFMISMGKAHEERGDATICHSCGQSLQTPPYLSTSHDNRQSKDMSTSAIDANATGETA